MLSRDDGKDVNDMRADRLLGGGASLPKNRVSLLRSEVSLSRTQCLLFFSMFVCPFVQANRRRRRLTSSCSDSSAAEDDEGEFQHVEEEQDATQGEPLGRISLF